jgi:hypothetical protein
VKLELRVYQLTVTITRNWNLDGSSHIGLLWQNRFLVGLYKTMNEFGLPMVTVQTLTRRTSKSIESVRLHVNGGERNS